jgi:voltage-gated potassium channel Kch
MIAFFMMLRRFFAALKAALNDQEFRVLAFSVGISLGIGTVFYHQVEGWSWLDSFYFSVITLTTIGYGDFSPTQPLSKLFTIVFIFVGLGLFVLFLEKLARAFMENREKPAVITRIEAVREKQMEGNQNGKKEIRENIETE